MSAFRKPLRDQAHEVPRLQALAVKPTPVRPLPTIEEKMNALRVAVRSLLAEAKHIRPDVVQAAEHALEISGGRA